MPTSAMIDKLRVAYEGGIPERGRSRATWVVLALAVTVGVAASSLAATMFAAPGASSQLIETPVADGPWLIQWRETMLPPATEQADQVQALRLVAGGSAALVAALCLLLVAGLWRQRLRLRRAEHHVHWAVGARRIQLAARAVGEGCRWAAGAVALSFAATAAIARAIEGTFPGDAIVSTNLAASSIALTALGIVLLRWEGGAGNAARMPDRGRLWEMLSSPSMVGAIGMAALSGVGILALHAPYAAGPSEGPEGTIVDASLAGVPAESRGDQIRAWRERLRASGVRVGFASAGAGRAAGHSDVVTVDCGECYVGVWFLPVQIVRAEVHAVAPDTFTHLGTGVSQGRDFDAERDQGAPSVAIVSSAMASRYFERGAPLGRQLRFGDSDWLTVVGVVNDRPVDSGAADYSVYVPLAQVQPTAIEVLADVAPGDVASVLADAPTGVVLGAPRSRAEIFSAFRWFRAVLIMLGAATLALVGAGLWVSAKNEATATRYEIAVRRAVGAPRRAIRGFVVWSTLQRLAGCLIGGAWLSLFIGAGLSEAYASIPNIDWAVWGVAGAWVGVLYALAWVAPLLSTTGAVAPALETSP